MKRPLTRKAGNIEPRNLEAKSSKIISTLDHANDNRKLSNRFARCQAKSSTYDNSLAATRILVRIHLNSIGVEKGVSNDYAIFFQSSFFNRFRKTEDVPFEKLIGEKYQHCCANTRET